MDMNELRRSFLDYFVEHGHTEVSSLGLIPFHPTAPMFTNSGMIQFVPYFLGEEEPPYPRAASAQKCVRLSGKHNDIDELGKTRRHLTFFEMLGNWSFADYFKEEAIAMAWEFVGRAGFDMDRIWITVHDTDDEAEAIWHESVGVPMERIQRMGKDNFWEMGETGPCGPCSEIFYDNGPEWGEEGGPAHGGEDRFIEFWNLVFMQNFRGTDGELTQLPQKHVDTGAGLERWLMLAQNVPTVFDTDALRPLIERAESISGKTYGRDNRETQYLRIVGDHARTMSFLVSDGVTPSNEGRGYVLRSVIRRAIRRGYQLGIRKPFLPEMVDATVDLMGDVYPELKANSDMVKATLEREEGSFLKTIASGSSFLEEEIAKGKVSGTTAFKLHDTFGFPIELTKEMAEDAGVGLDMAGYEAAMEEQRRRGRANMKRVSAENLNEEHRAIVEEHGLTTFTGYTEYESQATVVKVLARDDGKLEVFLDRTPFYAEAGGQVGDTGTITTPTGTVRVLDTQYALPKLICHISELVEGEIREGQEAAAKIDGRRRDAIRRNHTGTHMLHWALRKVLGPQVKQAGSLVAPDRLRFDFNHHEPLTREQIDEIERLANERILLDEPVEYFETSQKHAQELGAIAFFGEKYGDTVRVLRAGTQSIELCGGTHVSGLGMIGPIRIVSEASIGSNMRRVEAVTGFGTIDRMKREEETLESVASALKTTAEEVPSAVEKLLAQKKQLDAELGALRSRIAAEQARSLTDKAVNGFVVDRLDGLAQEQLREAAMSLRASDGIRGVILLGSPDGSRVAVVGAMAPDAGADAGELVAEAAKITGGGGGKGREFAMAGGRDASLIDDAVQAIRSRLGISG